MARCRLAMLECDINFETPWTRSRNDEIAAVASGLEQGDVVVVEYYLRQGGYISIQLIEGTTPLDSSNWIKYRIIKRAGNPSKKTTVEMLLR